MAVKLASRFYADDAVLEVLMSMPGIYNAYVDGDMAVLEVDEAVVKPGEAVRNALLKAEELGLSSIAFPAISTGVFGCPFDAVAGEMSAVFRDLAPRLRSVRRILVVLYGDEAYNRFVEVFKKVFIG
ncbi:MAG: macro domain-containing protein [Pyrobaculum sp.]